MTLLFIVHFSPKGNCFLHRLHSMMPSNFILNQQNETQFIKCIRFACSTQCHQTSQIQETGALQNATLLW